MICFPLHFLQVPNSASATLVLPLSHIPFTYFMLKFDSPFKFLLTSYRISTFFYSFQLISLFPPGRSNSHSEGQGWWVSNPLYQINLGSNHCFNESSDMKLGQTLNLISQINIVINCISLDASHLSSFMFCNMTKPS